MRLGIDLDGVCYDFAASFREYVIGVGLSQPIFCPEPKRWEFYEDWGFSLNEFLSFCDAGVDAGVIFTYGDPYPGTVEAMEAMRAVGHTLHVVTDRSFGCDGASESATVAWLKRHSIPFDSITFSPDKTIARVDAMVDDKPSNYAALAAAGVRAYLLSRPWNAHVENASRVASLAEFAEVFT